MSEISVIGEIKTLQDEVAYWRTDAAARLWFARSALQAECRENGYSDRAAEITVSRILPTLAALRGALSGDLHECCESCGEPLLDGQMVWPCEDTNPIHVSCAPDITAADTNNPSGPDPTPYAFEGFYTTERLAQAIAETEAALDAATNEPETAP